MQLHAGFMPPIRAPVSVRASTVSAGGSPQHPLHQWPCTVSRRSGIQTALDHSPAGFTSCTLQAGSELNGLSRKSRLQSGKRTLEAGVGVEGELGKGLIQWGRWFLFYFTVKNKWPTGIKCL